jgi:adenylate cyclase
VSVRLSELSRCFHGIVPASIATCGLDGEPNVTYLSQVHYMDERHVALSCQFFNKTKRNVLENPMATIVFNDPVTFEAWRLHVKFLHAEEEGPLFDMMAMRIDVIASHTGMAGVFKLISADVYEVLSLEKIEGFLLPPDPRLDIAPTEPVPVGPLTELRGLQVVSDRIARAADLEELLDGALTALDELFGFSHGMILVHDEEIERLVTIGSRGYGRDGVGASVAIGAGVIGTVAAQRRMVRVPGMGAELRYGRAIRGRVEETPERDRLVDEIPLPGLPDAQAQLVLPLLVCDRLVGVLAVESRDPLCFDEWDEAFLQIVANQIAAGIVRMEDGEPDESLVAPIVHATRHAFVLYRRDDCIFVDGEYLVRNVPAKILWKVLKAHVDEGRCEFTNRELRMDRALGLPEVRDNLESRLILLRKRLAEKCPDVRLQSTGRGRFGLELACDVELAERE